MTKWIGWLLAVVAVAVFASPAPAEEDPLLGEEVKPADTTAAPKAAPKTRTNRTGSSRGGFGRTSMDDLYAQMPTVLKLEGKQKQDVEAAIAAIKGENANWEKKLTDAVTAARTASENAGQDRDARRKAWEAYMALRQERSTTMAKPREALMALLTDKQKAVWAGFLLRQRIMQRYGTLKLTQEQTDQIQALCERAAIKQAEAVKAAAAAPEAPATDASKAGGRTRSGRGSDTVSRELYAEIESKVLTPEQRDQLTKLREQWRSGRGGKGGQNTGGKGGQNTGGNRGGGEDNPMPPIGG